MGRKIMAVVLLMGLAVSSLPGKAMALDIKVPKFLKLSNYRFSTEAERRDMARMYIERKNQNLKTFKIKLNEVNSPLLTQKSKDLLYLTYKSDINLNLSYLHAHATDYWYKLKDQLKGTAVTVK
jgi:hypothetical protein